MKSFECVIDLLETGVPVDLLYFDFAKAFDRVPHYKLISKLEILGIEGKLLNIINNFLSDRTLKIFAEGSFSTYKEILSGIPQGSVLGPLLFLIYVNDLSDYVKSPIKLFADDLKLIGNAENRSIIDEDLKGLELYKSIWLLDFKHEKCKVLHTNVNNNQCNEYYIDGEDLKACDQEKDLGVLTSDTLLWTEHAD